MPTVEIYGRVIHYLTGVNGIAPDRRSIVFVHGAGGNGLVWQNQRRGLDRGVNTICMDLPGHGQSPGGGFSTINEYSQWLKRFIHGLGLNDVVLAGHSMGGAVVMEAAIGNPDIVRALVLVGSGAKLKVNPAIFHGLETDFEATLEQMVRRCYAGGASKKLLEWGLAQLRAQQQRVILDDFRACDGFDRMGQIDDLRQPTLVLCGSEDIMTPPRYSQYLNEHLKQSALTIIEGAGHMAMVEDPFRVNAAIVKFLATI